MALRLFNVCGKTPAVFKPIKSGQVGLYTCGPTVYDFVHLGNWRTFIFEDILKRTLLYTGYQVKQVMNITDVDDKIINRAAAENTNIKSLANHYTDIFLTELKELNISPAEVYPRATEHLPAMIALVQKLIKNGLAYERAGSVYFAINKFPPYGEFSGLDKAGLKAGARVDQDEYEKEAPGDFVLWKAAKPGEPTWDSPWGPGRPGWHLECSAMSLEYLGETFDLHTGGVDLIFPHHENEIAQSEGATGKKFVNYWLEGEHLLIDGQKMSKSLGNIYTLKDLANKNFSPLAYRYLTLTTHYRKILNFTWESLTAAQTALNKLEDLMRELVDEKNGQVSQDYQDKFKASLEDDLNAPQALAVLWEAANDAALSPADKRATILDFDKVLGLGLENIKPLEIPAEVKDLIEKREAARQNSDFAAADKIRQEIESLGFKVDDSPTGPKIKAK